MHLWFAMDVGSCPASLLLKQAKDDCEHGNQRMVHSAEACRPQLQHACRRLPFDSSLARDLHAFNKPAWQILIFVWSTETALADTAPCKASGVTIMVVHAGASRQFTIDRRQNHSDCRAPGGIGNFFHSHFVYQLGSSQ